MKKRLVILGAGESGVGAAILAKQKGYDVFVTDGGNIKEIYKSELKEDNIDFEEAYSFINGNNNPASSGMPGPGDKIILSYSFTFSNGI